MSRSAKWRRANTDVRPSGLSSASGTGSFSFELQGPCSALTSWRAHIRNPQTFPLAAHNQELVLRHMTFALQQLFQISFERGLCFNHCIERFLYCGRQIICIDVLPLQFFLCHFLAPAWLKERNACTSFPRGPPSACSSMGLDRGVAVLISDSLALSARVRKDRSGSLCAG